MFACKIKRTIINVRDHQLYILDVELEKPYQLRNQTRRIQTITSSIDLYCGRSESTLALRNTYRSNRDPFTHLQYPRGNSPHRTNTFSSHTNHTCRASRWTWSSNVSGSPRCYSHFRNVVLLYIGWFWFTQYANIVKCNVLTKNNANMSDAYVKFYLICDYYFKIKWCSV